MKQALRRTCILRRRYIDLRRKDIPRTTGVVDNYINRIKQQNQIIRNLSELMYTLGISADDIEEAKEGLIPFEQK